MKLLDYIRAVAWSYKAYKMYREGKVSISDFLYELALNIKMTEQERPGEIGD